MARHNDGESCAQPLRSERETAESERKGADASAGRDLKTALAKKLSLMAGVSELQFQLIMKVRETLPGVAGDDPWVAGSCGESRRPVHSAVQSSAAVRSDLATNLDGIHEVDGDGLLIKPTQKKTAI